jgi:hypothetical protein
MAQSVPRRILARLSEWIDRRIGWDRLPVPLALLVILGIREKLRERNLYDTNDARSTPTLGPAPPRYLIARSPDGSYNDLAQPAMGMVGTRFGRNVPLTYTHPESPPALTSPNPRTVSRELLTRRTFLPAPTLNVLAAAWLQFETRDWFSHGTDTSDPFVLPRPPGDDWPEETIRLPRTPRDPTAVPGVAETFVNTETHWWDASQVYGSDPKFQDAIRTHVHGKVTIGDDGLIALDPAVVGASGGIDGWWVGLELLHTLFMREHNAICDRLRAAYPSWSDDQLFDRARLINAALIAKIHTVEWTTAILNHPALQIGMRANWFGLAGERIQRLFGRLTGGEIISGILGSPTNHHSAPYSITEEFVGVYRMHPLVPDDYVLRTVTDGRPVEQLEFLETAGAMNSHSLLERRGPTDVLYSFGTSHPGAVTLHNSPRFMQQFRRTDGMLIDLSAIDILRSRERGVPRYAEFRRLLHMNAPKTFDDLTPDREHAAEIRELYGDVENVDLTVGLFAEKPPPGFGFSDTAFRIFILMASRRLKSDRFFTVDFTPRIYTPEGMSWLEDNTMSSVLVRHYPDLAPALREVRNPFAPWSTPT